MCEAVVEEEVNQRTVEFLDADSHYEPSAILAEDWFVETVLMNPVAAGAVRSLLGSGFHLPVLMSNHRVQCPIADTGGWHVDGNYDFKLELNYLQVFYYPQDTPVEMGPTQVLPGSHLIHNKSRFMSHYGGLRGQVPSTAPAGSIFITAYHIWHRRGPSTAAGLRNMLKYFYWRTSPPRRDWVVDADLDFATLDYSTPVNGLLEQFRGDITSPAHRVVAAIGAQQRLGGLRHVLLDVLANVRLLLLVHEQGPQLPLELLDPVLGPVPDNQTGDDHDGANADKDVQGHGSPQSPC